MATNNYFAFSDGTTTCTFSDGAGGSSSYILHDGGWAVGVANARRNLVGGHGPYEDVNEEMVITVTGSTAQAAINNVETLNNLLGQAQDWKNGKNFVGGSTVAAVVAKFSPWGATTSSAASPLQAVVLEGTVQLPPKFTTAGIRKGSAGYQIAGVRVRFKRRGLWLHTTEVEQVASVTNGNIATFTFSETLNVPGPVGIEINNFGYGKSTGKRYHGAFVIVGDQVGGSPPMVIVEAEVAGSSATGYSVVAASAQNARGGSVLRYSPASTSEVYSNTLGSPALTFSSESVLVAVYANVRPSATVSFEIKLRLDSFQYHQFTPAVTIAAQTTQYPTWRFLGIVSANGPIGSSYLAITATAASSNLDIDSLVFINTQAAQVLAIVGPSDADTNSVDAAGALRIDHGLQYLPAPYIAGPPILRKLPYAGDGVMISRTAVVYGLLLATGGGGGTSGDEYRQADTSSDAVLAATWDLTRHRAYRVPE